MAVKIYVHGSLSVSTNGKQLFEVNGLTVGECLNDFISLIPKMREILFFQSREGPTLRSHIKVSVKEKSTEGNILSKQVEDDDEIHIKKNIQ